MACRARHCFAKAISAPSARTLFLQGGHVETVQQSSLLSGIAQRPTVVRRKIHALVARYR